MTDRSFRFTHAISRKPSVSITKGLRAVDTGSPDLDLFASHHADYVRALRDTGAEVLVLEALEAYPDAVFVEDTALCLQEGAIVMRPGAPSRLGEAAEMAPPWPPPWPWPWSRPHLLARSRGSPPSCR